VSPAPKSGSHDHGAIQISACPSASIKTQDQRYLCAADIVGDMAERNTRARMKTPATS